MIFPLPGIGNGNSYNLPPPKMVVPKSFNLKFLNNNADDLKRFPAAFLHHFCLRQYPSYNLPPPKMVVPKSFNLKFLNTNADDLKGVPSFFSTPFLFWAVSKLRRASKRVFGTGWTWSNTGAAVKRMHSEGVHLLL